MRTTTTLLLTILLGGCYAGSSRHVVDEFRTSSPDGSLDAVLTYHDVGGAPSRSLFRLSICRHGDGIDAALDQFSFDDIDILDPDTSLSWRGNGLLILRCTEQDGEARKELFGIEVRLQPED